MNLKPIPFETIIQICQTWKNIGGMLEVEIGALEPLLWSDGKYKIYDVIFALSDLGFKVSMTTNGQLLDKFATALHEAHLDLIRTSWHTTNPLIFKEISGGHGNYGRFLKGVTMALETGIKISFNRVLLKGYTNDLSEQLDFVEKYNSRLKLYTLMWTPENGKYYNEFYQDWRSIVKTNVLKRSYSIKRVKKNLGRERIKFLLKKGGAVEVKVGDLIDRTRKPCDNCNYKDRCEEAFGDYVRIDPRLSMYFCYMRRDLGFTIDPLNKTRIEKHIKDNFSELDGVLKHTSLRLTVTPFCNFNCRIPGENSGWCMEEPGEYFYPKIKKSLL